MPKKQVIPKVEEPKPTPKPTSAPIIAKAPTPTSTPLGNNSPPTYSASITPSPTLGAALMPEHYLDIKINGSNNPPPVSFDSLIEVSWISGGLKNDSCSTYGQNAPLDDGRFWLDLSPPQKSNTSLKIYAKDKELGYVNNMTLGVKCEDSSGNMVKDEITIQVTRQ